MHTRRKAAAAAASSTSSTSAPSTQETTTTTTRTTTTRSTPSSASSSESTKTRKRVSTRIVRHQLSLLNKTTRDTLSAVVPLDTVSLFLDPPAASGASTSAAPTSGASSSSSSSQTLLYSTHSVHADELQQQKRRLKSQARRVRRDKAAAHLKGVKSLTTKARSSSTKQRRYLAANLEFLRVTK